MESMKLFTDEDLMEENGPFEPEALSMEEQLARAMEAREMARMELGKVNEQKDILKKKVERLMAELRQERALRNAAQKRKSAVVPAALFAASLLLAVLAFIATDSMLMVDKLGDPLVLFFCGCSAFFFGMVWDRSALEDKMKGGSGNGNAGLQSSGRF